MEMKESQTRFIDEPIIVTYSSDPLLEKTPVCPDGFIWNGQEHQISEKLMEWVDYTRRGRMARNMSDAHGATAARKGSWGVGRFYFRVLTFDKQIFDIYYDRTPKGVNQRKGQWFVFRELIERKS
jgi:hypothetical protein